jgi:hypothetical protein
MSRMSINLKYESMIINGFMSRELDLMWRLFQNNDASLLALKFVALNAMTCDVSSKLNATRLDFMHILQSTTVYRDEVAFSTVDAAAAFVEGIRHNTHLRGLWYMPKWVQVD